MKSISTSLLCIASLFMLGCEKEEPRKNCIDEDKISNNACSFLLSPVCGCNGKTYPNQCVAENAGVTSWTEGECK